MVKLTFDYVYNYFKEHGCELLESEYINSKTKMKYICTCGDSSEINFDNFKSGKRCWGCRNTKISEFKTQSHESVYNYYKIEGYDLQSIYKHNKNKDILVCPNGHFIAMSFSNFKNHNQRCNTCYRENNFAENHPRFNPNREEIPLNQRLRVKTYNEKWIIKHMKDDPNYNNFLLKPNDYVVDHIIPVKLFCELTVKYNLNEYNIRSIINQRHNLQLLTCKENKDKAANGSLFEATQFLINNGVDILFFDPINGQNLQNVV